MFKQVCLIIILAVIFSLKSYCTHIVGGEIYYECLGNNKYRVVLKVYRDCYNGVPWFDQPARIGIYDVNSVLVDTLNMMPPGSDTLPVTINNKCIVPPANVCVEQCIYIDTITLPPIQGGYTLVYQRCCRNNTILNLVNPGGVGSTYFSQIPGPGVVTCNNSPHFNNYPPIFLCAGTPFSFDHSAIDPDGDSLVYELCNTYEGGSTLDPYPIPPAGPPYTVVPWSGGYNGTYPISSGPAISIDRATGMLTGTPNTIGQWVIGVCVSEYRNGVLLEVHKRDFQFNITSCAHVVVTSIPAQQTFCFGKTVNFLNNSINATSYHWDFGVPSALNDTSNIVTPSFTYPDTGIYVVTLVGNPGTICADTATTTFKIYPPLLPKFSVPPPQCLRGNSYSFAGTGVISAKSTYLWDFGSKAIPATSTKKDPAGIIFLTDGKHAVKFSIKDHGCTQSYIDTVTVLSSPIAQFSAQLTACFGRTVTFTNNSIGAKTFHWDFGVPGIKNDTSNLRVPGYMYPDTGVYVVKLIANPGSICADTFISTVRIYPALLPRFSVPPPQCIYMNSFNFSGSGITSSQSQYSWDFGPNATPSTSTQQNPTGIIFSSAGKQLVVFTISDHGCFQSFSDYVTVLPSPTSQFLTQQTLCFGKTANFVNNCISASTFHWDFGVPGQNNDTSYLAAPVYTYPDTGVYVVTLIADPGSICADTSSSTFRIYPALDPRFSALPPQCILINRFDFNGTGVTTSKSIYNWDFGPNATPTTSAQQNQAGVVFSTTGKQVVKLTISDYGCTQSYTDTVVVLPPPTAQISTQAGQCLNTNSFDFSGAGNVTSGAVYSWTFGTNAVPSASALQNVKGVTFNLPGKFPVTFTVTDHGCAASVTDTVVVYPLPQPQFVTYPKTGCKPLSVQFTDTSVSKFALSYLWNFGDGQTSTLNAPLHIYTKSGVYTLSLTIIASNGCVDTITFTKPQLINVLPGPQASFSVDRTTATISDPGFNFTDWSLKAISCKLFFGDGDSSVNCSAHHSYKKVGKYMVMQIVVDENGCIDTSLVPVEVTPDIRFWIPDAFTPDANGLNDFFMPVTEGIANFHFMIFDRWGELIFETTDQMKGWDGTYKKDKCGQDVYVYKIEAKDIKLNSKTYIGHVTLLR